MVLHSSIYSEDKSHYTLQVYSSTVPKGMYDCIYLFIYLLVEKTVLLYCQGDLIGCHL